jgi:four helix bundle protein
MPPGGCQGEGCLGSKFEVRSWKFEVSRKCNKLSRDCSHFLLGSKRSTGVPATSRPFLLVCRAASSMHSPGHAATRSDRAHTPVRPSRCEILPNAAAYGRARETAKHLRSSANSTRSNYRASRKGRSREEFQAKLQIAFEEADECVDCLEFLRDARIKSNASLLQEATEIAKILGASVKTARSNTARLKHLPKS